MRRLTLDELGDLGEIRFQEICASGGLICNKSVRDRAGWDFIVEFPLDGDQGVSLETRPAPISCRVQIKTTQDPNDKVRLRLTSLERLAKDPKPSFVYVLKVGAGNEVKSAHLIHLLDEPLAVILKRLRKEDVRGTTKPNRKTLSLTVSAYGTSIAPTGDALSAALQSCCGVDWPAYTSRKIAQLAKLGFDERPLHVRVSLQVSPQEFVDMLLGLKRDVPVSQFRASEVRFGIEKTTIPASDGLMTVKPNASGDCTVTARGVPGVPPAVLRGKIFLPGAPGIPMEYLKAIIETDVVKVVASRQEAELTVSIPSSPVTPTTWATYWRFTWALQTGKATIDILMDKVKHLAISIPVDQRILDLTEEECQYWAQLSEMTADALRYVGAAEPKLSLANMHRSKTGIAAIHAIYRGLSPDAHVTFRNPSEPAQDIPDEFDLLYVENCQIGDVLVGYYALCRMRVRRVEGQIEGYSDNVLFKQARHLINPLQDYEELIAEGKRHTGCETVWARELPQLSPSPEQGGLG